MNITSVLGNNWVLRKYNTNLVEKYKEKYSFDEVIARILVLKNINEDKIEDFLNPTIKQTMPNPYILKDMDKAVKKISESISNKETIGIFGDYDVDGASATALLAKFFNYINHPYETYIPDRVRDGYGPSANTLSTFIKKKIKTVITVDCGTVSFDAFDFAKKNNLNIIVLDHHQSETKLPKAYAIVNPNRIDCTSNLNYLCAAGVTFLFLVSLNKLLDQSDFYKNKKINKINLMNFLDLVCLGTICDVVPLINLNRAIVKQGLKIIKQKKNIGIKTLFELLEIKSTPTSYHIGYKIGPRINAGGRVGKSNFGSTLLFTDDKNKALKIAKELDFLNLQRQKIQNQIIKKAEDEAIKENYKPILTLKSNDWHEGVIGIIASRIKDRFNKPTILISLTGSTGKGSCRSVHGFDIGAAIISALNLSLIEKGGGHKMAGGFVIKSNKINEFKNFMIEQFKRSKAYHYKNSNKFIDLIISASALNEEFYNKINQIGPFGSGNSEPIFLIENVKIIKTFKIADLHIKGIFVSQSGSSFKGIAFNCIGTKLENYLSTDYNKKINIVGKFSLNEWQGSRNIEFIIEDISVIKTQ